MAKETFVTILALLLLGSCGSGGGNAARNETTGGTPMTMQLTSRAFSNDAMIPAQFTCTGEDISPPLAWSGIPEGTKSLALTVDDPDAPSKVFTHWVMWGIPPTEYGLTENVAPQPTLPSGARQGRNDFNKIGYGGPCPPSGTHHYQFHIYALKSTISLQPGASKQDLLDAMKGNVLDEGELVGLYHK